MHTLAPRFQQRCTPDHHPTAVPVRLNNNGNFSTGRGRLEVWANGMCVGAGSGAAALLDLRPPGHLCPALLVLPPPLTHAPCCNPSRRWGTVAARTYFKAEDIKV